MLCILCVTASDKKLNIFDDDGIRLNISTVVTKHFWLQPSAEDTSRSTICCSCWQALYSFHEFYQKVEEAHDNFSTVKFPTEDGLSENNDFDTCSGLFSKVKVPDIKLESCEEPKVDLTQVEVQLYSAEGNAETQEQIKSDSESDVPLGKLGALRKPTKREESASDTDSTDDDNDDYDDGEETDTDYKVPENNETYNNAATKREYNKHRIPCKQFDELIKQNMKLSCNVCHISLESFFTLKDHYRSAHNKVGYATCCEKKFDSRHALVHHIIMHKDPEIYKCMKCGRILADRRGLKRHMKTTHVNEERIHQCQKCKKSFRRIELLEKHEKTHVRPEVICEQCGKVVRGKQYLKQHQLREHSGIPKQRQQCPKCGVYLADNSTLSTHMKYQHPVVKVIHECHICGKISATGYGLKRHIEYMHTRGRPHKCTLCEKAFKTLKCLRPNAEDSSTKVICCSCWSALYLFHKFYQKVEEAHIKLTGVKRPSEDDAFENDFTSPESTDIKLETYDEPEADLAEFNAESTVKQLENIDGTLPENKSYSSSDSELPLAKLSKRRQKRKDEANKINKKKETDDDCEYKPSKTKAKRKNQQKYKVSQHIPNIYSQSVSRQDFDEVIDETMKLYCEICQIPLSTFFVLKQHYRSVHNKVGQVTCCDKKFESRYKLVTHILLHKNPEYFKCQLCNKVMANRKSLNNHMSIHGDDGQAGVYDCNKCQKSFSRKERLDRHLLTHETIEQICEQCGILCRDKNSLRLHQHLKHSDEPRPRVNCEKCGLDFASKTNVKFHMKHHHPESSLTHKCNICGKISSNAYGLKRHIMYMHKFERRHKCTLCEKAFKTQQGLRLSYCIGYQLKF